MITATLELLQRVKSIVKEEREWFDTISEWYKNAKLTRQLMEELLSSEETELLTLRVNEAENLAFEPPTVDGRRISWRIPAEALQRGKNTLVVVLTGEAQAPLFLIATSAGREELQDTQYLDLSVAEPAPAPCLELTKRNEARFQKGCWAIFPEGLLQFQLYLTAIAPVQLSLRMPEGRSFPWSKAKAERCQKLAEKIGKKVKKKVEQVLKDLEERRREARRQGNGKADRFGSDINDLQAYEHLHRKQIERAITAAATTTMELVIRETGSPDDLVRQVLRDEPILVVEPIPVVESIPVVEPIPMAAAAYRKPKVNPASRATMTSPATSWSLFGVLFLLAGFVATGVLGYGAWRTIEDRSAAWFAPTIKIDSLENGQLVPAGREFQVAVTTTPGLGDLADTELKVTATGAVEGNAPAPRRFAAGEQPTSQIFTFRSKQVGDKEETITLTAQFFKGGAPIGKPDQVTVKTGGTEMDLVFSIGAVKPQEPVKVTMTVLNARPATTVSFTVIGTDSFDGKGTLRVGVDSKRFDAQGNKTVWIPGDGLLQPVGRDAIVWFEVPGARRDGVVDTIEATIEGTKITRRAKYKF